MLLFNPLRRVGLKEHGIKSQAFGVLGFLYVTLYVAFGESRLPLRLSVPVCKKKKTRGPHSACLTRLLGSWWGGVSQSFCTPEALGMGGAGVDGTGCWKGRSGQGILMRL